MPRLVAALAPVRRSSAYRARLVRAGRATGVCALVALVATACAHAGPRTPVTGGVGGAAAGSDSAASMSRVGPIDVEIDNRSSLDAVVYVTRGSIRQRLGTVAPVSRLTARIPASFTDDRAGVTLVAYHLAGNTSFTSDRVVPQPGERLVLTLQTRLSSSTLIVQ